MTDLPYRPAVGVMLINAAREAWVGQRLDSALDAWQMPQGGLDKGETALEGALRELGEETGIQPHLVETIAQAPNELLYDLPDELIGKLWKGKWRGQRQTWFLMRFLGQDADVHIETEEPEFRAWRWVAPVELPALIVPFKRKLYGDILEAFSDYL